MPHLQALSEQTGEGSKVSVLDGDGVLVVAAVQGSRDYALTVVPGQRLPLHAGAASKVLLAFLPKPQLQGLLGAPLAGYTSRTIRDPHRLSVELAAHPAAGLGARQGRIRAEHPCLRRADPGPDRQGDRGAQRSLPRRRRQAAHGKNPRVGDRGRRRHRRRPACGSAGLAARPLLIIAGLRELSPSHGELGSYS